MSMTGQDNEDDDVTDWGEMIDTNPDLSNSVKTPSERPKTRVIIHIDIDCFYAQVRLTEVTVFLYFQNLS